MPLDIFATAEVLLKDNEPARALRLVMEVIRHDPAQPGMNYLLCRCLNATGRHEEALTAARAELLVDAGHSAALAEVARLSAALERPAETRQATDPRSYASALPRSALMSIQRASHNYSYKGVPMIKNPFDFALYPLLLWQERPRTILEIGSKDGGSALWLGDMLDNFGLDGGILSLDIVPVTAVAHKRVRFMETDARHLEETLTPELLATLPRPWLVIEDADHAYATSSAVLRFFHPLLEAGEIIVVEDGIISDLDQDPQCNSGPHRAIKEHLESHPGEYSMEADYMDFFGYNFTWCTNGFLRKTKGPVE